MSTFSGQNKYNDKEKEKDKEENKIKAIKNRKNEKFNEKLNTPNNAASKRTRPKSSSNLAEKKNNLDKLKGKLTKKLITRHHH